MNIQLLRRRCARSVVSRIGISALFFVLGLGLSSAAQAAVGDLAGRYEGAWSNLTFGSTGKAVIEIKIAGPSASILFDMDGFVFGGFDPPPIAMPGTVVGNTIQIDSQGVGIFGDIKGLVDATPGSFTSTLSNIPGDFITTITADGTIAGGRMSLGYTVVFAGPTGPNNPAHGVMVVAAPIPLIVRATGLPNGRVRLEWSGGKPPFRVQSRSSLSDGGWTNVGESVTGTETVVTLDVQPLFFRVTGS